MERMYFDLIERNDQTRILGSELLVLASALITEHKEYFKSVSSKFVFDDISSKNIIIKNGEFNGLVDLDQVMYGDILEPVGRIKASWYGTEYGTVYLEAIMKYLNLDKDQKELVSIYAILIEFLGYRKLVFSLIKILLKI